MESVERELRIVSRNPDLEELAGMDESKVKKYATFALHISANGNSGNSTEIAALRELTRNEILAVYSYLQREKYDYTARGKFKVAERYKAAAQYVRSEVIGLKVV